MSKKLVSVLAAIAVVAGASYYGIAVAADANKDAPKTASMPSSNLSPTAIVAKVNGDTITGADLLEVRSSLRPPANQMPIDAVYGQLQDRLIDSKLVLEVAKKAKLADDKEVKEKIAKAADRIIQDTYLTREVGAKVTAAVVEARYKKLAAEYKPEKELKARHILVATEAEAKAIAEQLKKGGDFAKIAKEKSTDKGSGEKGGDLGYFTPEQVVEPFSKTAFALKDGEVSAPVQSQFGWHIIQAQSRRDTKMPPLDEVKPDIQRMVADEMLTDMFTKLRKDAKIERFGIDGKPVVAATETKPAATPEANKKTQ